MARALVKITRGRATVARVLLKIKIGRAAVCPALVKVNSGRADARPLLIFTSARAHLGMSILNLYHSPGHLHHGPGTGKG